METNKDKHASVQYVNAPNLGALQTQVNQLLHDSATKAGLQGRLVGSPASITVDNQPALVQAIEFAA